MWSLIGSNGCRTLGVDEKHGRLMLLWYSVRRRLTYRWDRLCLGIIRGNVTWWSRIRRTLRQIGVGRRACWVFEGLFRWRMDSRLARDRVSCVWRWISERTRRCGRHNSTNYRLQNAIFQMSYLTMQIYY